MLDHLSLGVRDLARAIAFYDAALAPLGAVRLFQSERFAGYGPPGGEDRLTLFLCDDTHPAGRGTHVALAADSRSAVDAFHRAALAHGGVDEGSPGPRPQYGPHYYAAFVRDPDGHKLEAVCHAVDLKVMIEFHDSEVTSIRWIGRTLVVTLDAYLHVSDGGRVQGWSQVTEFTLEEATVEAPAPDAFGIDDGTIIAGTQRFENILPLPFASADPAELELAGFEGQRLKVRAARVALRSIGAPRYIEEVDP